MNPQSHGRIDELIALINLQDGSEVLDIGCGKGELLIHLAAYGDIKGTGVDLSPFAIAEGRERAKTRGHDKNIEFIEMEGKEYTEELIDKKFDLTVCMGASWIFDGHENTLKALSKITKENGLIMSGEPFWKKLPSDNYLTDTGINIGAYNTHSGNIVVAEKLGLRPIYALVSNLDDWDKYEHLQWLGADDHVLKHPEDPDNEELLKKVAKSSKEYLEEGRDVFGWAIYVFRNVNI